MDKLDRLSGGFWFAFALLMTFESYRLGLGSLRQPGPGFLFFWAGIILAVMSLLVFLKGKVGKKPGQAQEGDRKINIPKIILVLASVFLYAFLMEPIGFIPVTFLLFLFLLGFMERKSLVYTLITSAAVTGVAYMIFQVFLQSQLPKGLLGL